MRQVLVHGRIPSLKHGASIRPWTNTLSKPWSIRTVDEHPLKNMRQVLVHGRISSKTFVRGQIAPIRRMDFPSISHIYSYLCGVCNFLKFCCSATTVIPILLSFPNKYWLLYYYTWYYFNSKTSLTTAADVTKNQL